MAWWEVEGQPAARNLAVGQKTYSAQKQLHGNGVHSKTEPRKKKKMNLITFMMVAMNIVAIALIAVIVVQGQTGAGLGAVFGGGDIYRTRRGLEKTLWQLTISIRV